jgi:rubredoxin
MFKCIECGYIYDPEDGDPDHGVVAGTPFEELPPGWVCPECGVGRDLFDSID